MRRTLLAGILLSILCAGQSIGQTDVMWDGGDGEWNDPMWNGGMSIGDIVGQTDGADGYGGGSDGQNIVIGGGATVNYNANDPLGDARTCGDPVCGADFEMRQGVNFTITDGASFTHLSNNSWTENRWTELDLSNLIIDNGSFIRTGAVNDEGGGALIFGSWQGDDNFGQPASPENFEANIVITNGGRLVNEGQLWFGSWGDTPENGTVINMTINDGELDLTGGHVFGVGDEADADLVFTNRFSITNDPPEWQPSYSINFEGPGSITVDSSGIINAFLDDSFSPGWVPESLLPITYEQLWDAGILQANGLSGPDGENFADYFTTENSLGEDDYKLVSQITGGSMCGDFDMDGDVDVADRTIQTTGWTGALMGGGTSTFANGDCDADGDVDVADQTATIGNWTGAMAGNATDGPDADLIYDPSTGNVTLDASDTASGAIISFVLGTDQNNLVPENFDQPFINVGTNTDATEFQIGQTDPLNQGAGPLVDLGDILPTGMTYPELRDYLTLAEYASELGQGGTLDVAIPEPSSAVLALTSLLALITRRRKTAMAECGTARKLPQR